jgi:hypothetical protein
MILDNLALWNAVRFNSNKERRHYDARIVDIGIALARLTCTRDQFGFKPDLVQAFVPSYN